MRARDAVARCSFYDDPVDRYQNQALVTRMVLQQEKQAAIADRKGLSTVKLEGIVIEKRVEDEVNVQLVKHVIDQPGPSQISEQFVPTQLLLRRANGDWKIVSEHDLAPSNDPVNVSSKFPMENAGLKFQS